jgi:tRNA(Ile2) C34 agmatinyltransferase TiaS
MTDIQAELAEVVTKPSFDPLCGRCGGTTGSEGAWCNQCINECREYTLRLDNQAGGDQV